MTKYIWLLVIVGSVWAGPVQAQRFGEGRLLRRFLGTTEVEPDPETDAKPNPYAPQSRANSNMRDLRRYGASGPTRQPAYNRPNPQPTPAGMQPPNSALSNSSAGNSRSLYPYNRRSQFEPNRQTSAPDASRLNRRPNSSDPQPTPASRQSQRPTTSSSTPSRKSGAKESRFIAREFGVEFRIHDDRLVVTRLQKSGTAKAAGIKPGDVVTTIAGMEITAADDLKQLTEVLKPGDQIEFELVKGKKSEKKLVSYIREFDREDDREPTTDSGLHEDGEKRMITSSPTPAVDEPTLAIPIPQGADEIDRLRQTVLQHEATIQALRRQLSELSTTGE